MRFVHIAKNSAAELRTQAYIAQRIGVFSDLPASAFIAECKAISAMLYGLIQSFKLQTSIQRVTSGAYRTYYDAVYVHAWGQSSPSGVNDA